jgi:hypothetical protein
MTKRLLWCLMIFAAIHLMGSCKDDHNSSGDDKLPVKVIAVPSGKGWGYQIYVDEKLYIDQANIPAVSGVQTFKTREDALKIGNLVMNKMKNGKRTVTIQELKDAHIAFDSL